MLEEIVEPQKEGKFHELNTTNFLIEIVEIGILVHDSMINIQKSTNEKIEDRLEELRVEKEVLKASNKEWMQYMKVALGSTFTRTFYPSVEEKKNLFLKMQKERTYS